MQSHFSTQYVATEAEDTSEPITLSGIGTVQEIARLEVGSEYTLKNVRRMVSEAGFDPDTCTTTICCENGKLIIEVYESAMS